MKTFDVPDTIPRSKVLAFLADLGIDATYLRELNIGMNGVYVEVVALDEQGKPYVTPGSDEIAMHRIAIRLDGERVMAEPTEADRTTADDVARRILNGKLMQSAVRATVAQALADERERARAPFVRVADVLDTSATDPALPGFLRDAYRGIQVAIRRAAEETGQ